MEYITKAEKEELVAILKELVNDLDAIDVTDNHALYNVFSELVRIGIAWEESISLYP